MLRKIKMEEVTYHLPVETINECTAIFYGTKQRRRHFLVEEHCWSEARTTLIANCNVMNAATKKKGLLFWGFSSAVAVSSDSISCDCDVMLTFSLIGVCNFVRWINQKSLYADSLYVLFGLTVADERPCFCRKCW